MHIPELSHGVPLAGERETDRELCLLSKACKGLLCTPNLGTRAGLNSISWVAGRSVTAPEVTCCLSTLSIHNKRTLLQSHFITLSGGCCAVWHILYVYFMMFKEKNWLCGIALLFPTVSLCKRLKPGAMLSVTLWSLVYGKWYSEFQTMVS